ncbi:hypothetical protein [Streptomyces sp. NBC_01304]|uniref:hypothetical protein n=1 Tax=Streptomyces sp. NBC_01304 TaxID=2903818 RepID=UPI002E0D33A0|nr:hypothetical protein OG430_41025 [Streptomyces sp. NBC_01304]
MAHIKAEHIERTTGTYLLPCGCKIYVYFPGGTIHFNSGWVTTKCSDLLSRWNAYMTEAHRGESWASLTLYLDCLRHVGAWPGRISKIERLQSYYPNPTGKTDDTKESREISAA